MTFTNGKPVVTTKEYCITREETMKEPKSIFISFDADDDGIYIDDASFDVRRTESQTQYIHADILKNLAGNAAFEDDRNMELARILRQIAERLTSSLANHGRKVIVELYEGENSTYKIEIYDD